MTLSTGLVQLRRRESASPSDASLARVYVETYGCQMNVADTQLISALLGQNGWARVQEPESADLILMNTCAVREKAEERVLARSAELSVHKRRRPGTILAVVGCMAEHLKETLCERAPYVDVVAGPDSYRRLAELVERSRRHAGVGGREVMLDVRLDRTETYEGIDAPPEGDGVSGFITIQRGCDKFCTFCVVPFTRGRERPVAPQEVLRRAQALAMAGYKEVTLLGQTVTSYAHPEARFSDLLRAVAATDGLERVRFTSPYPADFRDDLILAIAEEPKIAKHVHLPLQSASDVVLSRMRRGYGFPEFRTIVRRLREAIPEIALTTDILVGFCGETEADHRATLGAMTEIRFDAAFMFAYSERTMTLASKHLTDDVAETTKKRRLAEVIELQERISSEVMASHVGRTASVLLHKPSKRSVDHLVGRTDDFKSVLVPRGQHKPGDLIRVRIERSTSATLFATGT